MVRDERGERARGTASRRRLLAAVATAATGGVAGCPSVTINIGDGGDGSGGGAGDSDESGASSDGSGGADGAGSGDITCTDVSGEYDRLDVGDRPILFDFEYPAVFGELAYTEGPNVAFYEASRSTGDGSVDIQVTQITVPEASLDAAPEQGASGATATFNGVEVDFTGVSSGEGLTWVGNLPYQVDGERRGYTTSVDLTVNGEGSNACGDALRAAATHFVETIELNSETTLPV